MRPSANPSAKPGPTKTKLPLTAREVAFVHGVVMKYLRDEQEAADVTQEALLRAFAHRDSFRGDSRFTTWLYRILTNCFLDLRKKERSRPTVSLEAVLTTPDGDLERQVEDPGRTPEDESERNERERAMERAVAALPEYQRAMIVMYHAEMLSYEEIAEALDLPIGTVKSRLNRARLSLREMLVTQEELFTLG